MYTRAIESNRLTSSLYMHTDGCDRLNRYGDVLEPLSLNACLCAGFFQ